MIIESPITVFSGPATTFLLINKPLPYHLHVNHPLPCYVYHCFIPFEFNITNDNNKLNVINLFI